MNTIKSIPNDPREIRAALLSKGKTVADFARENKLNIHTVRATIYGNRLGGKAVSRVRRKLEEVLSA